MRRATLLLAAVLLAPTVAIAAPSGGGSRPRPSGGNHGYVPVPPEQLTAANGAELSKILYLNRCAGGCTVSPGGNDARSNTSSIIDNTISLSAFAHGDEVWNEVVACLQEIFLPFDVEITQEDPSGYHHEAIIAGTSAEFGDTTILGVAPISCASPLNNVISFTLANTGGAGGFGGNARFICETAAQEMAHAFQLDHEYNCNDPMSYLDGCGNKYFRDAAYQCGDYGVEPCFCGGAAQNSHRKLLAVFGAGPGVVPPAVTVQLPEDGATVEAGFTVYAYATDVRGQKRAQLRINGYVWLEADADELYTVENTYRFTTPATLPDGYQNIEVRVFNDVEVYGSASIQVLKGAPCTGADSCLENQNCIEGACTWPEPTAELGDPCVQNPDCKSDLCPTYQGESFCSQDCTPGDSESCPDGFDCLSVGAGAGICWPGSGGGCCSLGGQRTGGLQLVLFAAVLLLVSTRRRARA